MRQKELIGAFFRVPIDEKFHTYGRILNDTYAFYDFKTDDEVTNIDLIEKAEILFKLFVKAKPIKNGQWKIIGAKELPDDLKAPVPFFMQEIGNLNNCWISINGIQQKATVDECAGLERLAVWEDFHVVKRLSDYYNKRRNDYAYALRLNGIL
jgi:hypothetical protein